MRIVAYFRIDHKDGNSTFKRSMCTHTIDDKPMDREIQVDRETQVYNILSAFKEEMTSGEFTGTMDIFVDEPDFKTHLKHDKDVDVIYTMTSKNFDRLRCKYNDGEYIQMIEAWVVNFFKLPNKPTKRRSYDDGVTYEDENTRAFETVDSVIRKDIAALSKSIDEAKKRRDQLDAEIQVDCERYNALTQLHDSLEIEYLKDLHNT